MRPRNGFSLDDDRCRILVHLGILKVQFFHRFHDYSGDHEVSVPFVIGWY